MRHLSYLFCALCLIASPAYTKESTPQSPYTVGNVARTALGLPIMGLGAHFGVNALAMFYAALLSTQGYQDWKQNQWDQSDKIRERIAIQLRAMDIPEADIQQNMEQQKKAMSICTNRAVLCGSAATISLPFASLIGYLGWKTLPQPLRTFIATDYQLAIDYLKNSTLSNKKA